MHIYNWQQSDWPNFEYRIQDLEDKLFGFGKKSGHMSGILKSLPNDEQINSVITMMLAEALKTSEIEGEYFSHADVLSSIRKNLGIHDPSPSHTNNKAAGIASLMTQVRNTYAEPLTKETLWEWHRLLMADDRTVSIGQWRTHEEPMQIISGAIGKTNIHFEAPPSRQVPHEMQQFITWFNNPPAALITTKNTPIRAAIAHLYFESIHPFEDGNGRIGRALAEKTLSQGIGHPILISLSEAIQSNKKRYYDQLEQAQRSNTITPWLNYFVDLVLTAQDRAEDQIVFTLKKRQFFDRHETQLNPRQKKALTRMLEEGPSGFEGGMTAKKYMGITKTSKATATRDIQQLLEMGVFRQLGDGGGRSTCYEIVLDRNT